MTGDIAPRERRHYWLSLAALVVVLPAAVLVSSWGSLKQWRTNHYRVPIAVERQAIQRYAGADWKLSSLTRLPGSTGESSVMLVEIEAVVDDPALLVTSPCEIALSDEQGRIWKPGFLTEPIVRELHPEAANKPRCGSLAFEGAGKGARVGMAETFTVPATAEDFALSIIISGALPDYLLLK
ncbi:MAG: hypothetical protein WBA88_02825 [Pseudaminobacter sp.]